MSATGKHWTDYWSASDHDPECQCDICLPAYQERQRNTALARIAELEQAGVFAVGQRVYINNPRTTVHGAAGVIVSIGAKAGAYPYEVLLDGDPFTFFYPARELSATRPADCAALAK